MPDSFSDRLSNIARLLIGLRSAVTKHFDARGRIALSGGGLRPLGPVGGTSIPALFESGRTIGQGPGSSIIWGRSGPSQAVKSPCYGGEMGLSGRFDPIRWCSCSAWRRFRCWACSVRSADPAAAGLSPVRRPARRCSASRISGTWCPTCRSSWSARSACDIFAATCRRGMFLSRRVPDRLQLVLLPLESERRRAVLGSPADVDRVHGDPVERRRGTDRRQGRAGCCSGRWSLLGIVEPAGVAADRRPAALRLGAVLSVPRAAADVLAVPAEVQRHLVLGCAARAGICLPSCWNTPTRRSIRRCTSWLGTRSSMSRPRRLLRDPARVPDADGRSVVAIDASRTAPHDRDCGFTGRALATSAARKSGCRTCPPASSPDRSGIPR